MSSQPTRGRESPEAKERRLMAEMKLNVARGFKTGTRISTIEVPAALRIKRSSGIKWVDEALGDEGGFTPTTTMMLTGGPGAGKSTLARQLANSLMKAGHLPIYNTGEESLYQAKMACERLKLDQDFMVGEEVMLPKLLNFCDSVKKDPKNRDKQVILIQDSLQTLDDGKYVDTKGESRGVTGKTPTYCAQMLVDWAQANLGIVIFIGQCTKGGEFAGQNAIKHAIDTHAHMFVDDKEKSDTYGCLLFEVQKNRWGCNGKTFILGLTKDGIEDRGHFKKAS
jgi:DNA repair protein RadA/Sms